MWWNEMRSRVILGSICVLVVIIMIGSLELIINYFYVFPSD